MYLSLLIGISFFQNIKNLQNEKKNNIERTVSSIQETYQYLFKEKTEYTEHDLKELLKSRVSELSNIFNTHISIYGLDGTLICSSNKLQDYLKEGIRKKLYFKENKTIITDSLQSNKKILEFKTYSYILIHKKPVAILSLEKITDNHSNTYQIKEMIKQNVLIMIVLMILGGFTTWYISKNLTKKIDKISQKLSSTDIKVLDKPLEYDEQDEIQPIVDSYNQMLVKLKEQTQALQTHEKVVAWKELATQVAHEINNPLTPMRLTVQNFERKFNEYDPNNNQKVIKLTQSILLQIDLISSITKSFSDFAKMPTYTNVELDMVETIKQIIEIYADVNIKIITNSDHYYFKMDKNYLTRILTNIIKNSIQAIPYGRTPEIEIHIYTQPEKFCISIKDNGIGIPDENLVRIFEPKFTTKPTGMGLGLPMIKKIIEDYKGRIWLKTEVNVGTQFFIEFYKYLS